MLPAGILPARLNPSASAVKPDNNLVAVHDHRDSTAAPGIRQHGIDLGRIGNDVNIVNRLPLLCIRFLRRPGKRSCGFAVYDDFFGHNDFRQYNSIRNQ